MTKIIITTSRRPTSVVRRFIKYLVPLLPYAQYQRRGKKTLSMLALQAVDFNVDKVLIIRNRKGNPGYVDVYQVDHTNKTLIKFCTISICGYSVDKVQTKLKLKLRPNQILILSSSLTLVDNEDVAECLLAGFNIKVCSEIPTTIQEPLQTYVIINVKKIFKNINSVKIPVYEIIFKDLKNEIIGPVIRICKAKVYTKAI